MVLLSIPFKGSPDRTAGAPALNVTVQGSIDNGNLGSTFLMNEKQEAREKAIQTRKKLPREYQEISSTRIKEIWDNVKGRFDCKTCWILLAYQRGNFFTTHNRRASKGKVQDVFFQ